MAGLQRGSVPGADSSVTFLCQKFSLLVERLQKAEGAEQDCESRRALLETELRSEEAEAEAERSELEAAAASLHSEAASMEGAALEVAQEEASSAEHLSLARNEAEALQQRSKALSEQCLSERKRLAETNSRIRHLQLSRPGGQEDLRRLQGELETLTAQYAAAAGELRGCRERAGRDDVRLAKLRAEALGEEEARDQASEAGAARREELDEALSGLALLKERLAEVQVGLQQCEEELRRRAEQKQSLWAELQRRESRLAGAAREMEGLQDVERGLQRALADTADVRGRLGAQEAEARQALSSQEAVEVALAEAELQLTERGRQLVDAERQQGVLRSEAARAEEEQAELEALVERLQHDEVASTGICQNLQRELQLLLAESEKLRHELSGRMASRAEAQQRLQLITPALAEARRRVRELEDGLEARAAETSREQQLCQRLEREAGVCQEKMRALRDENVRLAEQCTELDAAIGQPAAAPTAQRGPARGAGAGPRLSSRGQLGVRPAGAVSSRSLGGSSPRVGGGVRGSCGLSSSSGACLRSPASGAEASARRALSAPRTPCCVPRTAWGCETPPLQDHGWGGMPGRQQLPLPVASPEDGGTGGATIDSGACEAPRELAALAAAGPSLEYLRNWIESEEGRLAARRVCP